MISSITMTVFYILLYYACELIKPETNTNTMEIMYYLLLAFALVRIICCLFKQNNWFKKEGNQKWGIIRNVPFIFVGIIAVYGCIAVGQIGMAIAIIISFGCYLPVVFWAKNNPMIGMLMMPKTCMYVWAVVMGYRTYLKEK